MLTERREQRHYASHHQFYVEDGVNPGDTADPSFWTAEACRDCLAISDGTLGIGTGTYGYVRVVTEIHDAEPPVDLAQWDHVTEAGLNVGSGVLRVIGCLEDTGEEFQVRPGSYSVRCCHANLAGADELGEGSDWYLVQVWPAVETARRILKRQAAPA